MQLTFEFTEELIDGLMPSVYNLPDGVMFVYISPDDGKMYYRTAPNPDEDTGVNWEEDVRLYLINDAPKMLALDHNIEWPVICYLPRVRTYFTWYSEDRHRISMLPDDGPLYPPESPYRLYYGVDTEILYMNIAEMWQMIGTLHHGLLYDLEEDHHPQYLKRLYGTELPEPTAQLRGQLFVKRGGAAEEDTLFICILGEDSEYHWREMLLTNDE